MKLATWNVNSLNVRLPQVLDWLAANPVDVLALQELKLTDDKFPFQDFAAAGYQPRASARRPTTAWPCCPVHRWRPWCATSPALRSPTAHREAETAKAHRG